VITQLNAADGSVLQSFEAHTEAVTAVEWNSLSTQFLSASDDGSLLIWQP
jgi:WD40 repeat protein